MSTVTMLKRGRYTLVRWTERRNWTILPHRRTYWHGELIYWSWINLELIIDRRKDWLGDMAGTSKWAKAERAEAEMSALAAPEAGK